MGERIRLWAFDQRSIWEMWMRETPHRKFRIFSVCVRDMCMAFFLYFLTERCGDIKGWSFWEILVCQAYVRLSYGFLLVFFTGLRDFQRNNLARYLLKPAGVLSQVLLDNTDWFAVFGHVLCGSVFLAVGLVGSHVRLAGMQVVFLVLNLVGAVLIQAAFWLGCDAFEILCDRTVSRNIFYLFSMDFACFPLAWFPTGVQRFFTFVVPVGFVSYYPVLQVLGRMEGATWVMQCLSLFIGVCMYVLAYVFWRWGLWMGRRR